MTKGQKAEFRKKNTLTKNFEDYGKKLREQKSNLLKKLEPYMISVLDDILRIYKELGYKTDFKVLIMRSSNTWRFNPFRASSPFLIKIISFIQCSCNARQPNGGTSGDNLKMQ